MKLESRGSGQENSPSILPNEEEVPSLLPTTQGGLFRLKSRSHRWVTDGKGRDSRMGVHVGGDAALPTT